MWFDVEVGLVLSFCRGGVLEAGEGFADVSRHGEVDFLFVVVPFDGKSSVLLPLPVTGAFVVSPYRVD